MSRPREPTKKREPAQPALDRLEYAKLLLIAYAEQQQRTTADIRVTVVDRSEWVMLLPPNVHLIGQTFKEFKKYGKDLGFDIHRRIATLEEKTEHNVRFNFPTYFILCRPCNSERVV